MVSLITYHSALVYALVAVIVLNMLTPYSSSDFNRVIKRTRIGYFAFWGIWAMVVFAGLVVFVFMKQKLTLSVNAMIFASVVLPFIDGYRAIKLTKFWQNGDLGKSFSLKLLLVELLIVALTIVVAVTSK